VVPPHLLNERGPVAAPRDAAAVPTVPLGLRGRVRQRNHVRVHIRAWRPLRVPHAARGNFEEVDAEAPPAPRAEVWPRAARTGRLSDAALQHIVPARRGREARDVRPHRRGALQRVHRL
jgi:hypothetical protein